MNLADRIAGRIIAAARERNIGVNPDSVRLTDRERIACEEIAREIARCLCRVDGHQVVRVGRPPSPDDGA